MAIAPHRRTKIGKSAGYALRFEVSLTFSDDRIQMTVNWAGCCQRRRDYVERPRRERCRLLFVPCSRRPRHGPFLNPRHRHTRATREALAVFTPGRLVSMHQQTDQRYVSPMLACAGLLVVDGAC